MTTDITVDAESLRELVDNATNNIPELMGDWPRLYEYVGLTANSSYTIQAVSDALYKKIKGCFVSDGRQIWEQIKSLKTELIFEQVLDNIPLDPYLSVVERLKDALRGPANNATLANDDWKTAIQAALDHVRLQSWGNEGRHESLNARQFVVARAAKRLRQEGFDVQLEKGILQLKPEEEKKIVERLEALIKAIGGLDVAVRIFNFLQKLYDPEQERYHLVRRVGTMPSLGEAECPLGYLLLLAAKHPLLRRGRLNIDQNWQELIKLSTDYAALFDVQPYSQYELMFKDSVSIIPFLQEIAVYDLLFAPVQIRPRDAIKIAYGVLDWLDIHKKYDNSWSISEALIVAASILEAAKSQRGPVQINVEIIEPFCKGMRPKLIPKILKRLLSHPFPGANQNYMAPNDMPGPDFFKYPLLTCNTDNYCLLDASICAPGFIEALFEPLRNAHTGFDDEVGRATERFLRQELERNAINVSAGKYIVNGQEGECDLVVETSDTVIFLEIKKKPLTRKARAGTDIDILVDLTQSLLEAQLQAGWHEVRLRKFGSLDLVDQSGLITHLALNGRRVERISVTLFDYGGFQDRMLLEQFLANSMNLKYSTSHPNLSKKIDALNKNITSLRDQERELAPLDPLPNRRAFFNCWFLSVPQLLVILDSVKGNEDFKSALWSTRSIATGTLNFYFDHSYMKKLKSAATKTNGPFGSEVREIKNADLAVSLA